MHVARPAADEPCLCGGTRTFAGCCAAEYDRTIACWQRARDTNRKLLDQITTFACEQWGSAIVAGALNRFVGHRDDMTYRWNLFHRWFAYDWIANWEDDLEDVPKDWPTTPLGIAWLESQPPNTSEYDVHFVMTATESPCSLLRIEDVRPRWDFTVVDLCTGRRFRIIDPEVSSLAQPEHVLASAVLTLDGVSTLLGPGNCALPFSTRLEAADTCRCYEGDRWLTRAYLLQLSHDIHHIYEQALRDGVHANARPRSDDVRTGSCLLRWRLTSTFEDTLARLRPMTVCFEDEEAVTLDPRPDGEPEAELSWYTRGETGDPDDWIELADLSLTRGRLVAHVPSRERADALLEEIRLRLGADAELLEMRNADEPQPPLANLPRRGIC